MVAIALDPAARHADGAAVVRFRLDGKARDAGRQPQFHLADRVEAFILAIFHDHGLRAGQRARGHGRLVGRRALVEIHAAQLQVRFQLARDLFAECASLAVGGREDLRDARLAPAADVGNFLARVVVVLADQGQQAVASVLIHIHLHIKPEIYRLINYQMLDFNISD
ncbi:hypothetical protein D3C72_1343500 [compost metagenome]